MQVHLPTGREDRNITRKRYKGMKRYGIRNRGSKGIRV
jgi:hypothetical protein